MRPDVAAAFDRMAAAARRDGLAPVDHQRLPLRRRAGAPVRRQPEPEVGRAARHEPAPLRHRARPRAAGRLRLAGRERPPVRLHPPLRLGALALRLRREPARPRAPGAVRAAARGSRPAATTAGSSTGCRPSCRRASTIRSPRRRCAGTCRWSCWPRSSTRSPASTRSPRSAAGARGIAQFMPGTARCLRARGPVRPGRGDRRPGAPDERPAEAVRRQGRAGAGGLQRGRRARSQRYGGVPPYAETRAYVAKILGLLGGAGEFPVVGGSR